MHFFFHGILFVSNKYCTLLSNFTVTNVDQVVGDGSKLCTCVEECLHFAVSGMTRISWDEGVLVVWE